METYLDTKYISNVKIGDKMLRRDDNGGEKITWEEFTVNWTYWELMQEFPEDYKHLDGSPVMLIPVF